MHIEETAPSNDHAQHYSYGLALMDGQFWEEAIQEFSTAASFGFQRLDCWELSGDCASNLGRWKDAFRFYEYVYSDEDLTEERKKTILAKMSKCAQAQREENVLTLEGLGPEDSASKDLEAFESIGSSPLLANPAMIGKFIGADAESWEGKNGETITGQSFQYRVNGLLHIGSSSLVVELEELSSGKKYAGQALCGRFTGSLSSENLALWAQRQMAINSRHLVKILDLAKIDDQVFVVREHLPLSLSDILAAGKSLPVSISVRLGYQVAEALGDLHLHMSLEGKAESQFHLDLRPSRVLLCKDKPHVKIYNAGLWKEIERYDPAAASLREIQLSHLSYKAPEQFKTYLARKKPPIFTDIYLFGVLMYEMLTGIPPFKASSFAEYEIQHCEQYPTPPIVWKSEIPETLNDIVMNCLASDPMKRYRSTTQISLSMEKSFPVEVSRPKNDSYQKYLEKLRLA